MLQKSLIRSLIQFVGLCLSAVLLSATPAEASSFSCTERASACASRCGTTMLWEFSHWAYDQYHEPFAVYNYEYGNGIEEFWCDQTSEQSLCMCRY